MKRIQNPYSFFTCIGLALITLAISLANGIWWDYHVLNWDSLAFYLYLPSVWIYDDLGTLSYLQEAFFDVYQQPSSVYASELPGEDGVILKTPMGLAILFSPFFFLAHMFASLSGSYLADGFSVPYQFAMAMGGLLYAWLGWAIMRKALLGYFKDRQVALCLLIIVLGSNYFHYVVAKGTEAHNVLFTLYALLIYLTIRWHKKPEAIIALAIGVLIGLITLCRPTNLVCILIPLFWGVSQKEDLIQKANLLWKKRQQLALLVLAVLIVGSWQMIYWKIYSGQWFYYSYDDQGFDFLHPQIWKGLFSWHKGWLIYSPLLLLAVIGFAPLYRQYPCVFWPILLYFLVNLYIVFSWKIWAYGGGVGGRPLVESYAALMFPLAAMIAWFERTRWRQVLGIVILLSGLWQNYMLMWHANAEGGGLVTEQMNRGYYFKIMSSRDIRMDDKKILDATRVLRHADQMTRREIYRHDFEQDSSAWRSEKYSRSGRYSGLLDPEHLLSPVFRIQVGELGLQEGDWLQLGGSFWYEEREWNIWQQPSMTVQFLKEGQAYEQNNIRLYWLSEKRQWLDLSFDKPVPANLAADDWLEVYVSLHPENKGKIWIDDLWVELLKP